MDLKELLGSLHDEVAKLLFERVSNGEATAAEIAQAIQLLKHNNIQASVETNGPLQSLLSTLPKLEAANIQ